MQAITASLPPHPRHLHPVDPAQLIQRQQALTDAARQLKAELFGIDEVIDRVIDAIRAWYVLPQLISRPVIVCLWGLTGTGKTQLTRRLAQLLGFYDRFVEVQMDGFSHGASYRSSSISGMLGDSGISEGMPGVLVLDEFQRFRTVDTKGADVKVERYQDVWTLLSDGRLPPALSALANIERKLAEAHYEAERDDEEDERAGKKPYRFQLDVWDAQELKRMLKLHEPLTEIMQWPPAQVQALFMRFQQTHHAWETDYSKLLIFVCGNLDEMYHETAQRVEDCDTDADIFHRLTRKLSLIDVKKALGERFKPEQIARLGNEHVIYPSFSKATYERLIRNLCARYCDDIAAQCGVRFAIGQDVLGELYANAVFPAQGTRPLFSSVHAILSANLVNAALWVLEQQLPLAQDFGIALAPDRRHLVASGADTQGRMQQARFAVTLELNRLKQRANADFRALLAVHEAGHGLVYCLLFGQAPQEVKINIASFEGGYNSFAGLKATTRQNALDMMCVGLAGRVAEELVFGEMACTTGAEQDYRQVTAEAARHVRHHGFGERLSRTDVTVELDNHLNTDVQASNAAIEELLQGQYRRAHTLLREHRRAFTGLVDALMDHGMVTQPEMQALMAQGGVHIAVAAHTGPDESLVLEPFAARLAAFRQ
ncbi:ATP-dependent zinc metalloprotease FtsH 3 [Delftia tsuruhatensis]|uniref:AAA family ATPase n=1 Tax=Delftia tsuruhatensis TaxID=180282 RepID=UPI001E80D255|nr:AAA family ATPase [Delftia tsuruhatensis]CAB5710194.1 ATP-dependent zinc metalloprotease FtsH 3 [Delftia tsuruhatensis]CAC9692083.1 ATP-dependent zinc metalloprotease FtsH 3 [Delftia tsuruhatensis]